MPTSLTIVGLSMAAVALLVPASARTVTNPLGGLAEAYRDVVRLKSQIQTDQALQDLMRAQAAAVRAQTELMNRQVASPRLPDSGFNRAVESVRKRYPDFEEYRVEAARLMGELDT